MSFEISPARPGEWTRIVRWAADAGWNPGRHDAEHFLAQDPAGFLLGREDGEAVSAISVVNYSPDYAFLGFYLVRPDRRGRGLGIATWQAGMAHAGGRSVGLDGVPDQQHNYRRSGFLPAHTTIRYSGVPGGDPGVIGAYDGAARNGTGRNRTGRDGTARNGTGPLDGVELSLLGELDAACHPADRQGFATRWAADSRHVTRVRFRDGLLTGYGVLRPAEDGRRIGPLLATTPRDAEALLGALLAEAGGEKVSIDIPEPHRLARGMAERFGLAPSSSTARMYTGPIRTLQQSLGYGVMSLELG